MPTFYTINLPSYARSFYTLHLVCYAHFLHNKLPLLCPQYLQNVWLPLNPLLTTTNFSPNTAAAILLRCASANTTLHTAHQYVQRSDAETGNTALFPEHGNCIACHRVSAIVFRDTIKGTLCMQITDDHRCSMFMLHDREQPTVKRYSCTGRHTTHHTHTSNRSMHRPYSSQEPVNSQTHFLPLASSNAENKLAYVSAVGAGYSSLCWLHGLR